MVIRPVTGTQTVVVFGIFFMSVCEEINLRIRIGLNLITKHQCKQVCAQRASPAGCHLFLQFVLLMFKRITTCRQQVVVILMTEAGTETKRVVEFHQAADGRGSARIHFLSAFTLFQIRAFRQKRIWREDDEMKPL